MKFSVSYDLMTKGKKMRGLALPKNLDNVVVPPRMTARFEYPEDHTVELVISTEIGEPIVEELRIIRCPDRRITGTELRRLPLQDLVAYACADAAKRVIPTETPGTSQIALLEDEAAEQLFEHLKRPRRRNQMNDELLNDVAAWWHSELMLGQSRVEAVAEHGHVSMATAYRWVKAAKEAGYIDEGDE